MNPNQAVLLAALYACVCPSLAQQNQWTNVQKLRLGTPISVVERNRRTCELVLATDSELTCSTNVGRRNRPYVFRREKIRQVRLELPKKGHWIAGAVAGGVLGGLALYLATRNASDPETRGYGRVYGALLGAFVGGALGNRIHPHGAFIYERTS